MRNEDLVKAFSNGATTGTGSNLYIKGNRLVNYCLIIAVRLLNGGVILNNTYFSRTIAKNQNYVRKHCEVIKEKGLYEKWW